MGERIFVLLFVFHCASMLLVGVCDADKLEANLLIQSPAVVPQVWDAFPKNFANFSEIKQSKVNVVLNSSDTINDTFHYIIFVKSVRNETVELYDLLASGDNDTTDEFILITGVEPLRVNLSVSEDAASDDDDLFEDVPDWAIIFWSIVGGLVFCCLGAMCICILLSLFIRIYTKVKAIVDPSVESVTTSDALSELFDGVSDEEESEEWEKGLAGLTGNGGDLQDAESSFADMETSGSSTW